MRDIKTWTVNASESNDTPKNPCSDPNLARENSQQKPLKALSSHKKNIPIYSEQLCKIVFKPLELEIVTTNELFFLNFLNKNHY